MSSPLLFSSFNHPNYLFLSIKPNLPLPNNGVSRHSFSLPFLSFHPLPPCRFPSLNLSTPSSDSNFPSQAAADDQIAHDFSPVMKIYKDGRVERLAGLKTVPPGIDSTTGVESRDVVISKGEDISARIFLPKITNPDLKLPVLVYFHGGDFCVQTAFSPSYHHILNFVTSQANVIGVSVNYRNAPEHPVPICHEDSWTAVKWIASHTSGNGPDQWLNRHADLGKIFFSGDSTGANIAHHMAIRIGSEKPSGINLEALVLVHPFFMGEERTESERNQAVYTTKLDRIWKFLYQSEFGADDPLINPEKDPNVRRIDCKRVLICVAEEDLMRDRGLNYRELLVRNGFLGEVDVLKTKGENHAFHVFKPTCENAMVLLTSIAQYIKRD